MISVPLPLLSYVISLLHKLNSIINQLEYGRRRFGSVLDIIPIANTVMKLTARCELCGKKALFTLRKTQETETELIGGSDTYMPACRQHYVSGQMPLRASCPGYFKVKNDTVPEPALTV